MRNFIFITAFSLITITNVYCQELTFKNLEGIWFYEKESIYMICTSDGISHYFSIYPKEIVYQKYLYGFYDNCEPENIKDLKSKGTGKYFFMINDYCIKETGDLIQQRLDCWSISLDNYRSEAYYEPDSLYLHLGRKAILESKYMTKI